MKYIERISNVIRDNYDREVYEAKKSVMRGVTKDGGKGEVDSAISKFGSRLDTISQEYVIPHIKVCRMFKYNDNEMLLPILRMLNLYKRLGIHEAFKKMYPEVYKKAVSTSRRSAGISLSDTASLGFKPSFSNERDIIRNIILNDDFSNDAILFLQEHIEKFDITFNNFKDCNVTSDFVTYSLKMPIGKYATYAGELKKILENEPQLGSVKLDMNALEGTGEKISWEMPSFTNAASQYFSFGGHVSSGIDPIEQPAIKADKASKSFSAGLYEQLKKEGKIPQFKPNVVKRKI